MSTRRKPKEKARSHSISCSRFEWERIRELAKTNKLSMSKYLVTTALADLPGAEANADTASQRSRAGDDRYGLRDTAIELVEFLGGTAGREDLDWRGLPHAVNLLLETRLDEMLRLGRDTDIKLALSKNFDEVTASRLYEAAYKRTIARRRAQLHE